MNYLRSFLDEAIRNFRETCEEDLHTFVASGMKNHYLYGSSLDINTYLTQTALEQRLQELKIINKLHNEEKEFWINLIKNTFTTNCVCLLIRPSGLKLDNKKHSYEKMVEDRKSRLGRSGLEEKARLYRIADEENKVWIKTKGVISEY
uniref:Uncharacterized protein n=1 Tax=Meloidogyne enterolobii TaxID=390850 RepID=A0A6V7UM68_MELEN|nr:unnamed protein product [Meloidogyne enterolobii]